MKEETLSDKIDDLAEELYDELYHNHDGLEEFAQEVREKVEGLKIDFREFIKKLKKELLMNDPDDPYILYSRIVEKIDKLAGDEK